MSCMEVCNSNVFITGITGDLGQALQQEAIHRNMNVYGQSTKTSSDTIVQSDFRNLQSLEKFEEFFANNEINCLINNSAMYSDVELTNLTQNDIVDVINTNLTAPIVLTKYFYSNLVKQNKVGILVNINSLAGKYPNYKESIYCATKYGLSGFGASLSINQKKSNIKVIDCYIGAMKTNMTKDRDGYENFMDTNEVASFIFDLITSKNNYNVSSFEIRNIK